MSDSQRPAIPKPISRDLMVECGHRCSVCGERVALEKAHIIPWSKVKTHEFENLIVLCSVCHKQSHDEAWDQKTLRQYKRNPWVARYKNTQSLDRETEIVRFRFELSEEEFGIEKQRILAAVEAAIDLCPKEAIYISVKTGSIFADIELPKGATTSINESLKELRSLLSPVELTSVELVTVEDDAWDGRKKDTVSSSPEDQSAAPYTGGVIHYTEGSSAWKEGYLGFLTRFRGIFAIIVFSITMFGVPWWWNLVLPNVPTPINLITLSHVAGLFGAIVLSILFYVRCRSIKSLDIKKNMHLLAHSVRDFQAELHSEHRIPRSKRQSLVTNHLKDMCNLAAEHFSLLTGERDITACIRLAQRDAENSTTIQYKTYARSSGMNPRRDRTSEPISLEVGIPRLLVDNYAQGAIIIDSLDNAIRHGFYQQTVNDRVFAGEISSMIVAPLNGCYEQKYEMIGILCINSRRTGTFKAIHIDTMGFLSDVVATSVSSTFNLFYIQDRYVQQETKKRRHPNEDRLS